LSFVTDTRRGPSRTKVGEDGEGTLEMTIAKLLVIANEEALNITLDLGRGRDRLRGNGRFGFGRRDMS
jgi:hypothetical protein